MTSNSDTDRAIERLYANDWPQLLGTLVRTTRDLDTAEDALQEAIARAMQTWPHDGLPDQPAAWIARTARNIVIDGGRRDQRWHQRMPLLIVEDEPESTLHAIDLAFQDDRLRLIFTCCHPVLSQESRVALTLRMVCGLTTAEIARLFLVSEATMAARITRAKKKIAASGVPYRIPLPQDLPSRLSDVLTVIYLIGTEGHTRAEGYGLQRDDHMQVALRLSRIMTELVPKHPEVIALHAILLFADARKATRMDEHGLPLTLEAMDRSLWNQVDIAAAKQLTEESLRRSSPDSVGPYALQAAIAAIHADAATYEQTDWDQIVAFYTLLESQQPSAIVSLGKAIAIGMRDGPEVGLKVVSDPAFDEALPGYAMLPAARADFARRLGDYGIAVTWFSRAAELTHNETMRAWFLQQAALLEG